MSIKYSGDFKVRVAKVLPSRSIREGLNSNSIYVGRYLCDNMGSVSPEKIVELIDKGEYLRLKSLAQKYIDIKTLYVEWCDTYDPR